MMNASCIPSATLRAYRNALYQFTCGEMKITLRVDVRCAALPDVYAATGMNCGAFVTACNPHSVLQDPHRNADAHTRLLARIQALGLPAFDGESSAPDQVWPTERSLFIAGLALDTARAIGQEFRQNAIVWADADAVPRLVLLR